VATTIKTLLLASDPIVAHLVDEDKEAQPVEEQVDWCLEEERRKNYNCRRHTGPFL
jgi:hypothetical protein